MVRQFTMRALIAGIILAQTVMAPNPYGPPVAVYGPRPQVPVYVPQPGIRPIPQFAPLGQRCRQQFVPGVGWQQVCW